MILRSRSPIPVILKYGDNSSVTKTTPRDSLSASGCLETFEVRPR
jgi:hypothetical protein